MQIMKNHADLLREIDIMKLQIKGYELDLLYWNGNKPNRVLIGPGAVKYGYATASERVDEISRKMNALQDLLAPMEVLVKETQKVIDSLEGLEYQIAKMRYLEGKSYRDISKELGYSYSHITNLSYEIAKKKNIVKT